MTEPIRIMLVEDCEVYRETINRALNGAADIELVAEFSRAEAALKSLRESDPATYPDQVLLDLRLPGMDGLEALEQFQELLPDAQVIILTQSEQNDDVMNAVSKGACGYLVKSASAQQVIEAVRSAASGGAPVDAHAAQFILKQLQKPIGSNEAGNILSKRERDVLELMSEGLPKKEIAQKLMISYSTVDNHVSHIYQKLNVSNAPAAISRGYSIGVLGRRD